MTVIPVTITPQVGGQVPTIPAGTELWRVVWPDGTIAGADARAKSGNFAVVRVAYQYQGVDLISVSSSVANFLKIPHKDVMYLKRLQEPEDLTVEQKMDKWCAYRGRPYMYNNKGDDWRVDPVRWGCLVLGNNFVLTDKRQMIRGDNGVDSAVMGVFRGLVNKVSPRLADALPRSIVSYEAARLVCMRRDDMSKTPDSHPYLFHRMTSIAPDGTHGDAPFGWRTFSPLWSPLDWDKNGTAKCIALWVPTAWLERVE